MNQKLQPAPQVLFYQSKDFSDNSWSRKVLNLDYGFSSGAAKDDVIRAQEKRPFTELQ